jgi:hypothetical protein
MHGIMANGVQASRDKLTPRSDPVPLAGVTEDVKKLKPGQLLRRRRELYVVREIANKRYIILANPVTIRNGKVESESPWEPNVIYRHKLTGQDYEHQTDNLIQRVTISDKCGRLVEFWREVKRVA